MPTAPVSIFSPPSSGSPAAPGVVYTPPGGGSPPATPGEVYVSSGTLRARIDGLKAAARLAELEASIASMFTGVGGAWYDGRADYVKQDSAGTTAVAAASDMVGRLIDRSGNGKHCLQTTSGQRSRWSEDGSVNLRGAGGAPRFYQVALNLTGSTAATVIVAVRQTTTSGQTNVLGTGVLNSSSGGFEIGFNATGTGQFYVGAGISSSVWCYNAGTTGTAGQPKVASVVINPAGATLDDKLSIREYGTAVDEVQTGSGAITTAIFQNTTLCIGAVTPVDNTGGNFDFYGAILIGRLLTSDELAICEEWAALRCPNTTTTASVATFADSGPLINDTDYQRASSYASISYRTTATAMEVTHYDTDQGSNAGVCNIGIWVNGFYQSEFRAGVPAASNRNFIPLAGAWEKLVTLVCTGQSWSNYPTSRPNGVHLQGVRFNAAATVENAPATNRLVIYGDSISVGAAASPTQSAAWGIQVRAARAGKSTAFEGWGWRSLYQDAADGTKRAAFVARLLAYAPATIWLAIGTNDYGITGWNHTAFGTAYAALLDDLHAVLPATTIVCQSPLIRSVETAGANGSTMAQYRAAILAATVGRAWATYIDGAAILTTGGLSGDGLHPSTAGHATIAAFVENALGVQPPPAFSNPAGIFSAPSSGSPPGAPGAVFTPLTAGSSTAATVQIGTSNAKLRFTAVQPGTAANGFKVSIFRATPHPASQPISISYSPAVTTPIAAPATITIAYATDGTGTPTSTAAQLLAAVNASTAANVWVVCALGTGSDGSGTAADAEDILAGGTGSALTAPPSIFTP